MSQSKRIVIIAGEESGDIHAANFIRELKQRNPLLQITGIGGIHMQEAGALLISDLARFGVTGVTEVIRHLRVIRDAFKKIKAHLTQIKPDLLVLVDYPGFNLRLAKFAKEKLGIKILYYISPQIWAWKANRIHTIKRYVDRMAVILPFEKQLYEDAKVPVNFVGHPLVNKLKTCDDIDGTRKKLSLPTGKTILAILPGSRLNEVTRHMPTLVKSALLISKQQPNLHIVIPVARTIDPCLIENYLKNTKLAYSIISANAVEIVACSDFVIVASGTASLECALLTKPMCIIYKVSYLTYFAAMKFIKVRYLGLCNLLQNQMIAPELLQDDFNPEELAKTMLGLIENPKTAKNMVKRLQSLKDSLSIEHADLTISQLIEQELRD